MKERKYFVDNIRWLWILLLVPFHAAMAWSCFEGNYIWFGENKVLSSLVVFISPWFMPMLFVLAGMSANFALRKRSYRQYMGERVRKLLLPLLSGVLTVVAFMTYIADKFHNHYQGNFWEHYSVFFTKLTDLTGYDGYLTPGHLWFLLFLFLISAISLPVTGLQRKWKPSFSMGNLPAALFPVLLLFPLILTPVLNFGGKSIGQDFALFLLGFYVFSEDGVLEKLTRYCGIYLVLMVLSDVALNILFVWRGQHTGIMVTACNVLASWFGILGFLGLFRSKFDQNNSFTRYMRSQSFLIYIFHFGWPVIVQYYLGKTTWNTGIIFAASVFLTYVLTFLTCEIVQRTPGIRYLFGATSGCRLHQKRTPQMVEDRSSYL